MPKTTRKHVTRIVNEITYVRKRISIEEARELNKVEGVMIRWRPNGGDYCLVLKNDNDDDSRNDGNNKSETIIEET